MKIYQINIVILTKNIINIININILFNLKFNIKFMFMKINWKIIKINIEGILKNKV